MKYNIYVMSKIFFFKFTHLHIQPYFFQSLNPFLRKVIFKEWASLILFQCVYVVKTIFIKRCYLSFFTFILS